MKWRDVSYPVIQGFDDWWQRMLGSSGNMPEAEWLGWDGWVRPDADE
jgi:hypothetical protein